MVACEPPVHQIHHYGNAVSSQSIIRYDHPPTHGFHPNSPPLIHDHHHHYHQTQHTSNDYYNVSYYKTIIII